jgi:REP element-mobilizing transposase RayT
VACLYQIKSMVKFRKANRLTKYNYSQLGYYFVTICTKNRFEYFGKVENDKVILSSEGGCAEKFWQNIPQHYQNIGIDQFVIMPNHLHGIIIIKKQATGLHYGISQIVGSYKNVVAKNIHANGRAEFGWQPSFYDHVIRKDESLHKIREYIVNNPIKWELDRNNTENLWM